MLCVGLCDVGMRLVAHRRAGIRPSAASRAGAWLPPWFRPHPTLPRERGRGGGGRREASRFIYARSSTKLMLRAEFLPLDGQSEACPPLPLPASPRKLGASTARKERASAHRRIGDFSRSKFAFVSDATRLYHSPG